MTTANVVHSGPSHKTMVPAIERKIASGQTILPGHLVTRDSSGDFINHNVAGQGGDVMIIDMNTIEQRNATTALTAGERYKAFRMPIGEEFNLVLAVSQTITEGEELTSAGNGQVRSAATNGTETVMFIAEEAITTTGSATQRIRVSVAPNGRSANT